MFVKEPMNKERLWKIKNVVLMALALACYSVGVMKYYELRENYQSVSVQLQGEGATKEQLKTLLEEEKEKYGMEEEEEGRDEQQKKQVSQRNKVKKIPEITAYEKEEHRKVSDTKFGKTKNVTKYLVYGGMNQILPIQIYSGNYVYENDYEGCMLDRDTAYALFGSLDVIGQQVVIDEKVINKNAESNSNSSQGEQVTTIKQREYYVRGILDTSHPVVMVQTREDKTQFHYLQFDYGNSSRGREYVEQLMMVYPLGSSGVMVDQNLIVRLLGNVLFLPWLLAGIIIIWKRVHQLTEYFKLQEFLKQPPRFFAKLILPPILAVIGIVVTAKRFAFFPLQYIPTKWSDFSSVSRTINLIREHIDEFNYMTPTIRDVLLKENIAILVIAVVSMIVLMWVVIERIRARET
ncbi:hypothetical protein SAMN02746066_00594 [Anaerosporobacter mobilis DSM 15930]|uniref:MacB-like core domain-containing protein n=1 Tax=Anaerosporobacter mobilis DSM 15930 TaxID=1120996 RepID=A0A1M7FRT1_9FIRM|nr:hypothetical protein [Anaerosporobacter mobilis]SHM06387.1 hypothetical protein SAMN02746066_00594 [Anaerosporobacter mobilis DSM 15930]